MRTCTGEGQCFQTPGGWVLAFWGGGGQGEADETLKRGSRLGAVDVARTVVRPRFDWVLGELDPGYNEIKDNGACALAQVRDAVCSRSW